MAQQIERTTLRAMTTLTSPDAKKTYRVSDSDKQSDWQYDPNDDSSIPNIGTPFPPICTAKSIKNTRKKRSLFSTYQMSWCVFYDVICKQQD
ncbi:MAG: hypothetical protein EAZ14_00605 [Runella slithyformis]|nr:MAG: hypothetical protein EAZ46_06415 [Runella sp.]TAG19336.1 MAG: hypothetical protein EAZ38_12620 [Cytophagales bacterium]TAG38600.1 MAG: hypothetical protein EAZ32_11980 [Cytophagia bacterium]TAG53946.1 MAG: hypothetical protein EAZ29_05085 [Runella slithyformis]TAG80250.1 MAG: hypothetical protein EAZ22_09830 [Cytophagales bacterium]